MSALPTLPALPTGTITFLFTDIEGSTKLWDAHSTLMRPALERHDTLLRAAIVGAGGVVFKTVGDAFCAAFASAPSALEAATTAQTALLGEPWPQQTPLRVRMALHTGIAQERGGDYFGPVLNRVARLLSAGHGGQTLVSAPTYELVRDHLSGGAVLQDLGSHRLKDLERPEHVYQVGQPGLPDTFAPLKTLDTTPNNLPPQLTSFIGREKAIADATALLSKTRLLTLTGSGGSGKSRLSLQVAADALDNYADGAWIVELAPLSDPALVPQAVAQVLNIKEAAGQSVAQTVTEWLKDKPLLLLLDNCEHLLGACATFVAALLRACPTVRIIATSREPLGIAGEQTYRVPSLTLPNPQEGKKATVDSLSQFEAVRLFIERGQAVKPDFAITNQNAPALAQLCYRLDGIPLAIELAAARVRSLSVEQINDKLDTRFRILTGGDKAALPRQQTLRALVDWSYDLLTDTEKTMLARLSVFAGGWTLEAAEAVCGYEPVDDWEVLDLLTSLVDKSLVAVEAEGDGAGETRYRMLETLKQYGGEKRAASGENESVTVKYRDYFVALVEAVHPKQHGPEQQGMLDGLEAEYDNLRAVLDECATASAAGAGAASDAAAEAGLRLAGSLRFFWGVRGYLSEGRERAIRALERSHELGPTAQKARIRALLCAGYFASAQGDHEVALVFIEEGLVLSRDLNSDPFVADALACMGRIANYTSDYEKANSLLNDALVLYREIGDQAGVGSTLQQLGSLFNSRNDHRAAKPFYEEGLALYRALGDPGNMGVLLTGLGDVANCQGEYETARALYEEALVAMRTVNSKGQIAGTLGCLANLSCGQGDFQAAKAYSEEALALLREIGDKTNIQTSLTGLGWVAYLNKDYDVARSICEESLELSRKSQFKGITALSTCNLGYISNKQGNQLEALSWYAESLALMRALRSPYGVAYCFEGIAYVLSEENQTGKAATLLGAANALRGRLNLPLPPSELVEYNENLASVRSALGEAAFSEAWEQGRAMDWEQAVDYALNQHHNAPE